jgi:hypothetical protein
MVFSEINNANAISTACSSSEMLQESKIVQSLTRCDDTVSFCCNNTSLSIHDYYPNIVEEDSSGCEISLTMDHDYDDSLTIDPIPLADYNGIIRLASSSIDDDTTNTMCTPNTIRNVWNVPKRHHRYLTEDDNNDGNSYELYSSPSHPKRQRNSYMQVLPPFQLQRFDSCDISVIKAMKTLPQQEEQHQNQHDDESTETATEITVTEDEHELQQLIHDSLKSLIASMRRSEGSRVQVLEQVEHLPQLYSPHEDGILVDTDLDCFFDAQESSINVMEYAIHQLGNE